MAMSQTAERPHLLLVGDSSLDGLCRVLVRGGHSVAHVPSSEALSAVHPGLSAAVLSGARAEILQLTRKIKERLPAPFLPVLVLVRAPRRLPEEPTAPDAWLAPDSDPRDVAGRVAELLRLRRADAEMVRLNAMLAELAAENGLLYERARREAESSASLLRELQHRVRNNLAAIQALLVLERHRVPQRPLSEALDVAIARLRSMAALQDALAPHTVEVHIASLAAAIARGVCEVIEGPPLAVAVRGDALLTSRAASSLALVLGELISNARRHARATELRIEIDEVEDDLIISVQDDGKGLPEGHRDGSGLMIARTVARNELRGQLELSAPGTPAYIVVRFPLDGARANGSTPVRPAAESPPERR
jgi:two-component sensor histidine kinase